MPAPSVHRRRSRGPGRRNPVSPGAAIDLPLALQLKQPGIRADQVALLLDRAYAAAGRPMDAGVQLKW